MIEDNVFIATEADSTSCECSISATSVNVTASRELDIVYQNVTDLLMLVQIEITLSV